MNYKRIHRHYAYTLQGWLKDINGYRVVVNTPNLFHNISYTYSADKNRLSGINVTGTGIGSSSYQYDALGNLIRDNNENINVTWNVIGKVKSVQTPNNILSFAYNPFGQRQIKRTASDSTYYIHDATGNVMSIYVKDYPKITAKERPIYGSSRLGIMNKEVEFNLTGNFLSKSNSTIGIKEYELCDHLSNVSVVILDRKECTNSVIKPIVKTYTDYYPFGYPISSRTDNVDYRYGYNGKEYDNEMYNTSNFQDYGMRMYDTRIARFWGVDPLKNDYPMLTPFQFASNSPIWAIDLDGMEKYIIITKYYSDRISPEITKVNYKNVEDYGPLGNGTYSVTMFLDGTFSEQYVPDKGNSISAFSTSNISQKRWIEKGKFCGLETRLNARLIEGVIENALVSQGFNKNQAREDVQVLETDNVAFKGKFATFKEGSSEKYTSKWEKATPSNPHFSNIAKISNEVGNSDVLIKYYDGAKSNTISNHIGLVREGFLDHLTESIRAKVDSKINIGVENAKKLKKNQDN